jgi:hypothetical protein
MNSEVFKNWFISLLKCIEVGFISVMDNANYHSTFKEEFLQVTLKMLT